MVDLEVWENTFRSNAKANDLALFRDHLRRHGLPNKPKLLLEGTIHFVVMWCAFHSIDNDAESFARLLQMQTYDPEASAEARYAYTFNLFGKAYARVLVDSQPYNLDLADMFDAPWDAYRIAGYSEFYISHLDASPLSQEERDQLQEEITADLRYDFTEDELCIDFVEEDWDSFDESYLHVLLQEIPECDREDL